MKLSEFNLQPRGPYLFDTYLHPEMIATPLGDFQMEMHVDDAAAQPADEEMLAAMVKLRKEFVRDLPTLVRLVFEQYQQAVSDDHWREFCDLPAGLKDSELSPLLEARSLTVARDAAFDDEPLVNNRVYMSPSWDEEHGLYFTHEDGEWEQVDS